MEGVQLVPKKASFDVRRETEVAEFSVENSVETMSQEFHIHQHVQSQTT